MKFGSLFSGIEAASVAWEPLGWRCAWVAEIDPFASAVLRHRYPQIPNLGDVNEIEPGTVEPVDLVVFGSPCQSFSVAGKRLGLDDPRGNMALVGLRVVGAIRPRWVVWENVPGVLSSDGGRDFGAFLGLLGELGYGFAYRVLDAQHFGVPQRRRRVFVVGCLGDWRAAAAVLFEPESLRGDSPPRREAGERVARPVASCAPGGSGYRCDADTADSLIAYGGNNTAGPIEVATACNAHGGPCGRLDFETETFVCGFPDPAYAISAGKQGEGGVFGSGCDAQDTFVVGALPSGGTPNGHGTAGVNSQAATAGHIVACGTLGASNMQHTACAMNEADLLVIGQNGSNIQVGNGSTTGAISTSQRSGHADNIAFSMSVRRLTPRECERLQGLPDDYTLIPYRGKPAADGPRYRAIGNSMAVPVVRWIGERIQAFEGATAISEAAE